MVQLKYVLNKEDYPRCPHCGKELKIIEWFNLGPSPTITKAYRCPHCKKLLPITETS